jgi:hypothetical protein
VVRVHHDGQLQDDKGLLQKIWVPLLIRDISCICLPPLYQTANAGAVTLSHLSMGSTSNIR